VEAAKEKKSMDQQPTVMQQMMDLHRNTIDGILNNIVLSWEQAERMVGIFLEQAQWLPEEGKRAAREWTDAGRKSCEGFKMSVNDGFTRLEEAFIGTKPAERV
jgi:hypothetical protein